MQRWNGMIPFEPRHDKTNNVAVHPAKTQISLGIRPVWSVSSLSTWRKLGSLGFYGPSQLFNFFWTGGGKMEDPQEKQPAHLEADFGLSELGSNSQ